MSIFPLDAGGPLLLLFIAAPIAVVLLIAIVVLEAILLRVLKWDASFGRCFAHALAINAVSALAGCALMFAVQIVASQELGAVFGIGIFAVAFVITVLVEWLLLRVLNPSQRASALQNTLIINLASYAVLIGASIVLGIVGELW
jgi:hypothetical protein